MKERYHISGMTCSACSAHVEKAVSKLPGMEKASVNLLTETMEVSYQENQLTTQEIVTAVEKAGYGATLLTSGASGRNGVSAGAGASERTVAVASERVGNANASNGRDQLQKAADKETRSMKWRLGISVGFLIPLMYVAMYHMIYSGLGIPMPSFVHRYLHGNENAVTFALTQLLLLLPILYMNRKFFSVGFKTLFHFAPNMDSLIALGSSAAVAYGIFAL